MFPSSRIILIMGVAGSGKSTIGKRVAAVLGWPYFEADDFHPPANKSKMSQGLPLTDVDRAPWLAAIRTRMDECRANRQSAVFTCSALKEQYRRQLGVDSPGTHLVHLTGDMATILARVGQRQGHYMKAAMVQSQFEALEAPAGAQTVSITLSPEEIVQAIMAQVNRPD